jgi:hypothetical protein
MHNSGATRREIANAHLKLFWLFENRIGTLPTVRAAHPSDAAQERGASG